MRTRSVILAIIFAVAMIIPARVLLRYVFGYLDFLNLWTAGTTRSVPLVPPAPLIPEEGISLNDDFRITKFTYKDAKAKTLNVVADFNNWGETASPMKKNAQDVWELVISLPTGKYRYGFEADGKIKPDAQNPNKAKYGTQTVSLMEIE